MFSRGPLLVSIAILLLVPSAAAGEDSLLGAMRAFDADSFNSAIELSSLSQQNPWLEVYRLHMRAEAFMETGDSASAAERAVSALRLVTAGGAEAHPAGKSLIDLAVICGGPAIALPFITDSNASRLDPQTLLQVGRYYLTSSDTLTAASYISIASRRRPGRQEMPLLNELVADGAMAIPGISAETSASFASSAISAEEMETARILTGIIRSSGEYEWLAGILEGDLLAATGRKTKALTRYRAVFDSDIYPVEGKRRALQKLAGLQYRMKRYRDASASYRTYGLYYPDDPLAEMSTDRSARIEVASGRWETAVDTWRRIADSGPKTLIGREALLGLAVVLERLKRNSEACEMLQSNIGGARGRLRSAYLYWIDRTCGGIPSLSGNRAGSFYAKALEDGTGFLNAGERKDSLSVSSLEAGTRKIPFPGTGLPADHPSLGAFRYFASGGRKKEATECAHSYIALLDNTEKAACLGTLYEEALESGLESLCLEMTVDNAGLFAGRTDYIEYLYPFAYGDEIDRYSRQRNLPPELVLAVIREESRFDETVMSQAGAWGLMQVMPSTGEWIGGKLGRKDISIDDLLDPGFNIEAGCWYLRFLLDRADGSLVGTLAAYNAGHGRMRTWKKKFSPHRDPLAALELIGPSETRQYVRRVLDSMSAYTTQTSSEIR